MFCILFVALILSFLQAKSVPLAKDDA